MFGSANNQTSSSRYYQGNLEAMKSRPLSEEERRIIEQRNQVQEDLKNAPKRFGITITDLQKHGVTQGCSGWKSAFTGKVRQPHTKECRARFEKLLEGESRVKASRDRADEFFAKVTEASSQIDVLRHNHRQMEKQHGVAMYTRNHASM